MRRLLTGCSGRPRRSADWSGSVCYRLGFGGTRGRSPRRPGTRGRSPRRPGTRRLWQHFLGTRDPKTDFWRSRRLSNSLETLCRRLLRRRKRRPSLGWGPRRRRRPGSPDHCGLGSQRRFERTARGSRWWLSAGRPPSSNQ
jgi:hypothetical protein